MTTVIYVQPSAPRELSYRPVVGGRVSNFGVVRLREVSPEGRYTARQPARAIPEEVVMASGLFEKAVEKGKAEGRAEGRTEGRAEEARRTCLQIAQTLHPAVASRVAPVIEACSEPLRLRRWTLRAPRLSDAEFVTLVTGRPHASVARSRTSRPSRASRRSSPSRKRR